MRNDKKNQPDVKGFSKTPDFYNQVSRKEFGHSPAMTPPNDELVQPAGSRRVNYQQNFGYRQRYDTLDHEDHSGKGPRNYQRSDERIKEEIIAKLTDDPYVDATGVDVSILDGEVILTGTIPDKKSRWRVDDILEQVRGIGSLENRLRIKGH